MQPSACKRKLEIFSISRRHAFRDLYTSGVRRCVSLEGPPTQSATTQGKLRHIQRVLAWMLLSLHFLTFVGIVVSPSLGRRPECRGDGFFRQTGTKPASNGAVRISTVGNSECSGLGRPVTKELLRIRIPRPKGRKVRKSGEREK